MSDTQDAAEAVKTMTELEFIRRVLWVTSHYDNCDSIWWRTPDPASPATFLVNCNDLFAWGTGDCEELTPENVAEFERAHVDCAAAGDKYALWGPSLFCARVRKERPQGAAYPKGDDMAGVRALFNACGPERAVDFLNPKPVPA